MVDLSFWAKLVTMLVGIFSIFFGYIFPIQGIKKAKLRDEYRFLKEFFADRDDKNIHPYVVGKGCFAVSGDPKLTIKEFDYLMTLDYPIDVLKQFSFTRKYLEHVETSAVDELVFKGKLKSKKMRVLLRFVYGLAYFACAFVAIGPLFFFKQIFSSPMPASVTFVLFIFLVFGSWALNFLFEARRLLDAEKLFRNQKKRTSTFPTELKAVRGESSH